MIRPLPIVYLFVLLISLVYGSTRLDNYSYFNLSISGTAFNTSTSVTFIAKSTYIGYDLLMSQFTDSGRYSVSNLDSLPTNSVLPIYGYKDLTGTEFSDMKTYQIYTYLIQSSRLIKCNLYESTTQQSTCQLVPLTGSGGSWYYIAISPTGKMIWTFSVSNSVYTVAAMQLNSDGSMPTTFTVYNSMLSTAYGEIPNELVPDFSQNIIFFSTVLGGVGRLYSFNSDTMSLNPNVTLSNRYSSAVVVSHSLQRVYICSSYSGNKVYIEARDYSFNSVFTNKVVYTFSDTGPTPLCKKGTIDDFQGQIFFYLTMSGTGSTGGNILSVDTNGNNAQVFPIQTDNAIFYPSEMKVFNSPPDHRNNTLTFMINMKLHAIKYTSPCGSDCNGNGYCQNLQCQCNPNYSGIYCETFNTPTSPILTSVSSIAICSASEITISGSNLLNGVVTVGESSCTVSSSTTSQLTCTIPTIPMTNSASGASYIVSVKNPNTNEIGSSSFFYSLPSSLSVTQSQYTLTFTGTNIPDCSVDYSLSVNGVTTVASMTSKQSTSIKFDLLKTAASGPLIVSSTVYTFPAIQFNLKPIITSISPSILYPTTSQMVVVNGYFFGSASTVNQGSYSTTGIYSNNVLKFSSASTGFQDLTITVTVSGVKSDPISYTYVSPTYTSSSFSEDATLGSVATIVGQNMGTNGSLISVAFGANSGVMYSFTGSGNQSTITVLIPRGTVSGEIQVNVNYQLGFSFYMNMVPKISQITPKPSVSGDSVEIQGKFLKNIILQYTKPELNIKNNITTCSITDQYNEKIICTLPSGTGSFLLQAISPSTINYQEVSSSLFQFEYKSPTITAVSPLKVYFNSQTTFTISGSNFGNIGLIVSILNNNDCVVNGTSLTSSSLECKWNSPVSSDTLKSLNFTIEVDTLEGNYSSLIDFGYHCPIGNNQNECSNHGICDFSSGKCQCTDDYTGEDCSTPPSSTNNSSGTGNTDNTGNATGNTDNTAGGNTTNETNTSTSTTSSTTGSHENGNSVSSSTILSLNFYFGFIAILYTIM
ncbi:hypothetical protein DLAC_04034 [Tieghemostelium lacteum]|uniref:EGF-like domain-containing protein n=1 Tax=Tieghemostelium lacteum TaxID=361077 RepID=A0A151ZS12_TIELA|nr:hypothetical protein DLAC_04034 [Tieghemostelium lacteum]|eukprot:KYQ96736.1 hypothetical protein DLAC_04034 [Tieghemostelium lacteum]